MDKNQVTMWVARDKNGDLYLYRDKPRKDSRLERWVDEVDYCVFFIDPDLFPSVKWEDVEPTEVVLTLKNSETLRCEDSGEPIKITWEE